MSTTHKLHGSANFIAFMNLESKIRADHPLRRIKVLANATLKEMDVYLTAIYSPQGRASASGGR